MKRLLSQSWRKWREQKDRSGQQAKNYSRYSLNLVYVFSLFSSSESNVSEAPVRRTVVRTIVRILCESFKQWNTQRARPFTLLRSFGSSFSDLWLHIVYCQTRQKQKKLRRRNSDQPESQLYFLAAISHHGRKDRYAARPSEPPCRKRGTH